MLGLLIHIRMKRQPVITLIAIIAIITIIIIIILNIFILLCTEFQALSHEHTYFYK